MGTSELAYNRTDIAQLYEGGTVYLLTASYASDSQGGSVPTFGTSGTVAGKLRAMTGAEQAAAGGVIAVGQFMLDVPWDTVLNPKDRVKIYGRTFEVSYVTPDTPWQLMQNARVTEIT